MVFSLLVSLSGAARADEFDDKINALQNQVSEQKNQAAAMRAQADTLANKLAGLQRDAAAIQTQINLTQTKFNRVTEDINQNEQKLAQQKAVLSANIKTMYLDSKTTPIEMLASSRNLSDYMDQQQYQDKIKTKIQDAMSEIQTLQKTLQVKQVQLTQNISDQKGQRQQLAALQSETANLLASTRGQEAAYQSQAKSNTDEIGKLKAQQAAALAARFGNRVIPGGTCGGGYPAKWCNAAQDSLVDNWGMYNRECVSYTAYKVWSSGRHMPYWGGVGNAKQWPGNARAAGIPVDGNPRVGDVAIDTSGPWGHAMYVEAVNGNTVFVSQYNFNLNGEYSTMNTSASGLQFIHFR